MLADPLPGDLVLLHDPQTAGLAAALASAGARVAWRCHIGVDWENDATRAGWGFLRRIWPPRRGTSSPGGSTCHRVLAPGVRATVGSQRDGLDHTALDRPVFREEPAPL